MKYSNNGSLLGEHNKTKLVQSDVGIEVYTTDSLLGCYQSLCAMYDGLEETGDFLMDCWLSYPYRCYSCDNCGETKIKFDQRLIIHSYTPEGYPHATFTGPCTVTSKEFPRPVA